MSRYKNKDNFIKWLYLLFFGAIIFIVAKIYNYVTKDRDTSVDTQQALVLRSTLTNTEAKNIANQLFNSMNQFGTDEQMLFRALQNLTRFDFEKVYKMFGKKSYNGFTEVEFIQFDKQFKDLRYWLESELSKSFYKVIEKHMGNTTAFPLSHFNNTTFSESIEISLEP